jgi:hypothetical protein
MSPVWMIEGSRELDPISERNLAKQRFSALAAAIREHEATVRLRVYMRGPKEAQLYRRLRQICGELTAAQRP